MSQILPIGGGKGGSGKSFIAANLGAVFARLGKRVLLIDLDLGGSNLHTLLGIKSPEVGLHDFLSKAFKNLDQVAVPTALPGLFIVSSANCSIEAANLVYAQKKKIIDAIRRLTYDYVLLDLGAGTGFNALDFFLTSNEGLFVVTPEPTSIENAFRFIKAIYWRKMGQILSHKDFKAIIKGLVMESGPESLRNPADFVHLIMRQDQEKGELLISKLGELHWKLVINQFRRQADTTLGDKIAKVCNRHFCSRFQFLDYVGYDEKVYDSVASRDIYVNRYPHTSTAAALQKIAKKISRNGIGTTYPMVNLS